MVYESPDAKEEDSFYSKEYCLDPNKCFLLQIWKYDDEEEITFGNCTPS